MRLYLLTLCLLPFACSSGSEPTQQAPAAAAEAPAATSLIPVDTVRGFGRHHFGDPLRSFPPLTLVHQSRPDLATYRVAAEGGKLHFGPVPLIRVTYTFYKQKLYGINYYAAGAKGLRQLTAEGSARYGQPMQVFEGLASWKGQQFQAALGRSPLDSAEAYYLQFLNLPMLHQLQASSDAEADTAR